MNSMFEIAWTNLRMPFDSKILCKYCMFIIQVNLIQRKYQDALKEGKFPKYYFWQCSDKMKENLIETDIKQIRAGNNKHNDRDNYKH